MYKSLPEALFLIGDVERERERERDSLKNSKSKRAEKRWTISPKSNVLYDVL